MAKATEHSNTRRGFLAMMAAAIPVAIATGSTVTLAAADPIFAAIDAHRTAVNVCEAVYREHVEPKRQADLPFEPEEGEMIAETIRAKARAAAALIATAPTTCAGLRALSDYLPGSDAAHFIRPFGSMMGGGVGAAEWLIAKRAAELGVVVG